VNDSRKCLAACIELSIENPDKTICCQKSEYLEGDSTFKLGKCAAYDGEGFYAKEKAHTVSLVSSIMFLKDGVDQSEAGDQRPGDAIHAIDDEYEGINSLDGGADLGFKFLIGDDAREMMESNGF